LISSDNSRTDIFAIKSITSCFDTAMIIILLNKY
jgi:hypothetical protein